MFRIPQNAANRKAWIEALKIDEGSLRDHHRVCSKHFPNGDQTQMPSLALGQKFLSPKKHYTERGKRALKRKSLSPALLLPHSKRPLQSGELTTVSESDECDSRSDTPFSAPPGEQLLSSSDYSIHELPSDDSVVCSNTCDGSDTQVLVNKALLSRIEVLEAENKKLRSQLRIQKPKLFRVENISHNNTLVKFYTGFISFEFLLAFFQFLGPAVHKLRYWGTEIKDQKRKKKLDPLNQLFLTLVKLRLNLRERDLAHRFGLSVGTVSKYFITWVCFLYHHLKEISWMPSVDQVRATLPYAFNDKYPTTYTIVDGSEVFIEKPSDLHLQSSTWSNYKQHNTAKFLLACTPNGAVMYVSPLYVGSISDVELTRVSGFVDALQKENVVGMSVMADRGFTIKDQLDSIGAKLNIPPFLDGREQLPPEEIRDGRQVASLRIHVERVIGRVKNYSILKGTLPLSMSRISNQIVCVCSWLVNFQPVLIPPPCDQSADSEVEDYFDSLYDTDSNYDADTELSDDD